MESRQGMGRNNEEKDWEVNEERNDGQAGRSTSETEHELHVYERGGSKIEEDDREDEGEKWRVSVGELREAAQGIEADKAEEGDGLEITSWSVVVKIVKGGVHRPVLT